MLDNTLTTIKKHDYLTLEIGRILAADEPTPLAFSNARLFTMPKYALFAEVAYCRDLGDYVRYSIQKWTRGAYNADDPIYESDCFEDITDVWSIFANG